MKTSVRAGIVALAAATTTGAEEPVVKREDTSTSWTQSTDLDDDDLRDDDLRDDGTRACRNPAAPTRPGR